MSNRGSSTRVGALIAAIAATALLITGCVPANDVEVPAEASPGITNTTVRLGISSGVTGPNAAAGACTVAGLLSYIEARNADGGFEFGDGITRTVELEYLDDGSDPATALDNFRQLVDDDEVFAYVGGLGMATNAAIAPVANEEEIPQVLLMSAATKFSVDQQANPWTLGLLPSYYDEGFALGESLAARAAELTVATLAPHDEYGDDYVAGFRAAIAESDVKVVAAASYDSSAASLAGQVTELAASGAGVLLSAVSVSDLQVGVLTTALSLGWTPELLLPSNTSTPATVVIPGNGAAFPAVYTTTFSELPSSPDLADDPDVIAYNAAFDEYGSSIATTFTPHCAWSYIEGAILEQAFLGTAQPTRANFLAALHAISGFEAPLLLDGVTVDTTDSNRPAILGVVVVRFTGTAYEPLP